MKTSLKLTVDFENKTVTTEGMTSSMRGNVDGTCTFEEAGITEIDRDIIEEHLTDRHGDQYDVEVEFVNPNFHKNAQARVSFCDLDNLGWDFTSIYEGVAQAQGITFDEAKRYENENYYILIQVTENGGTTMTVAKDNTSYGSEWTGDDEQTIKDLYQLHSEGKLWNITEY